MSLSEGVTDAGGREAQEQENGLPHERGIEINSFHNTEEGLQDNSLFGPVWLQHGDTSYPWQDISSWQNTCAFGRLFQISLSVNLNLFFPPLSSKRRKQKRSVMHCTK